jgi:hypothetical protein
MCFGACYKTGKLIMSDSPYGFGKPFIDVDEWRGSPCRHRYVHGGFEDSHTRFSIYLPPEEQYQGRFFHFLQGGAGGSEHSLAVDMGGISGPWVFDAIFDEFGGYLVESNQGHFGNEGSLGLSTDVECFGASAESALFSKQIAAEMYGEAPHHGYVWGVSGGGHRTTSCPENRPDVWAGGVPQVIGGGGGPQSWPAWAYWWLFGRAKRADILDATLPGGSGDPFATLTVDESQALSTIYKAGWPRGAENALGPFFSWLFHITLMHREDPTYVEDFWSKRGYVGHDDPERMARVLVDRTLTVADTLERGVGEQYVTDPLGTSAVPLPEGAADLFVGMEKGSTYGLVVDEDLGDPDRNYMATVVVLTGKAKGRRVHITQGNDHRSLVGLALDEPDVFDGVVAGDQIRLENRDLIAFAHLWQYAIPFEVLTMPDPVTGERVLAPEYRGVGASTLDGRPIYPQRPTEAYGSNQTGRFEGRMIHLACTHDVMVMPAWVPRYGRMVRDHLGERTEEHYRLWWTENADHGGPYGGATVEAFRCLVAWCEDDIPPPSSTSYRVTDDGGIVLPATAAERHGIQPVVEATANGGTRAEVRVGESVTLRGIAEQPPATDCFIASAAWEFDSDLTPPIAKAFAGRYHGGSDQEAGGHVHEVSGAEQSIKVETTHTYETPGTYFPLLRVTSHRHGSKAKGDGIENEARVRVVVR